jgi:SAM-dependent methyltransferase
MPRLKRNLVLPLARGLKAFLRLDMGVGRRVPESEPEVQIQRIRQRLHQRHKGQIQRVRQQSQKQLHTLPEPNESISNFQIFHSLVSPLKPGKMLDLGTGAGTFSLIAAQLGWEVTAVDARTVRMPDPEAEKDSERALVRSVGWVEADVREFPIPKGEYDLICIFGLLHHLELEAQIKLLRRCSNTLTFLAVRVVDRVVLTEGPYEGINRREPGETREERDQVPWAAWGNEASFKHTEESLLRLFQNSGYTQTMVMRPPFERNYTFYVCLPAPLAPLKLEDLPVEEEEVRYHYRNRLPADEERG